MTTRLSTLLLAVSLGLSGLVGCASSSTHAAHDHDASPTASDAVELSLMDETPIDATSATLHVEGLSCPACATNVDHQLKDLPGVRHVAVNLGDGTVNLSLGGAGRPSRAELARAIHDSGFTLRRIDVP
jgi:copper chaperone CopZ